MTSVERDDAGLFVVVQSVPAPPGCPGCGVVTHAHGGITVELVDLPCFERPVRLRWVKRRWSCLEPACATEMFVEQNETIARPRGLLPPPRPEGPRQLVVRARLLDLVHGRSGTVYRNWLIERGDAFWKAPRGVVGFEVGSSVLTRRW